MPSAGKTDSRDSIKSKAFEKEGVGWGRGEEKRSGEGGSPHVSLAPSKPPPPLPKTFVKVDAGLGGLSSGPYQCVPRCFTKKNPLAIAPSRPAGKAPEQGFDNVESL